MVQNFTLYIARLYRWLVASSLTIALLLLPIAVFGVYFFTLSYNIPWFDDFENIPYFLDQFLKSSSFEDKLSALLRPNNEHRVLYARLVALLEFFLTGGLNFTHLMLWGNAALVVMFYLIYRALLRHEGQVKKARVAMLPVSLLLFSAQMYLMTFTAVFTLQYLSIIMLAMLTFFVLATDRPAHLGGAALLGILSSFSMGNGLLVWPAGAGMLLIQRRWGALGIWLLLGATCGYFYFLGYPVQQGNANGFAFVMEHPWQIAAGFIILAGNAFDIFPTLPIAYRVYLPFLAGLILLAGLGYWLIRTLIRPQRNTSFLETFVFGCLLFLLATFALFAVFRIRFNFEMVVHISYRVYALTLCSLACVLVFYRLSEAGRMHTWPIVWVGFLALNIGTYITYLPLAIERRSDMQALTFNQLHNNVGLGGNRNSNLATFISGLLAIMKERNWYQLPNPAITTDERSLLAPVSGLVSTIPLRIERHDDYITVNNDEADYRVGYGKGTYVILKSVKHTYLLFASVQKPLGIRPWLIKPGFRAAIPIQLIQPGVYQLGLFRIASGRADYRYVNQLVTIN